MRKIFEQLFADLGQFLRQRDDLLLLVPCDDTEVALLLKALRDLDRESGADMFLLFAEDFESAGQFLNDTAERLDAEQKLTNEAVAPELRKLPPLPGEFLDVERPPAERLEAGLQYARSLVDPRLGQHFVWAMGPGKIGDPESYLELLAQLTPNPDIRPWMRGARIVARVPADFQLETSPLTSAKRIRVRPFSIPPDAIEQELLTTAADQKSPPDDRMRAEVQLAYLDCAHGRLDDAITRFLKTLAFYQWAEIPAMEGLVICGLGDVARRQENWHDAEHWYQCAVVPAAKSRNPMLMSTIVQNLAVAAFRDKRFSDAEQRYSELVTLKRAMLEEDGLAEALEWQGLCAEEQLGYDRAVACWEEGALICKTFELKHRLGPMADHLRRGYQALEMGEDLENFDSEWAVEGSNGND